MKRNIKKLCRSQLTWKMKREVSCERNRPAGLSKMLRVAASDEYIRCNDYDFSLLLSDVIEPHLHTITDSGRWCPRGRPTYGRCSRGNLLSCVLICRCQALEDERGLQAGGHQPLWWLTILRHKSLTKRVHCCGNRRRQFLPRQISASK